MKKNVKNIGQINDDDLSSRLNAMKAMIRRQVVKKDKLTKANKIDGGKFIIRHNEQAEQKWELVGPNSKFCYDRLETEREATLSIQTFSAKDTLESIEYTLVRVEQELCWAERELEYREVSKEIDKTYQTQQRAQKEELQRLIQADDDALPNIHWRDFENDIPKEFAYTLKDYDLRKV